MTDFITRLCDRLLGALGQPPLNALMDAAIERYGFWQVVAPAWIGCIALVVFFDRREKSRRK